MAVPVRCLLPVILCKTLYIWLLMKNGRFPSRTFATLASRRMSSLHSTSSPAGHGAFGVSETVSTGEWMRKNVGRT